MREIDLRGTCTERHLPVTLRTSWERFHAQAATQDHAVLSATRHMWCCIRSWPQSGRQASTRFVCLEGIEDWADIAQNFVQKCVYMKFWQATSQWKDYHHNRHRRRCRRYRYINVINCFFFTVFILVNSNIFHPFTVATAVVNVRWW